MQIAANLLLAVLAAAAVAACASPPQVASAAPELGARATVRTILLRESVAESYELLYEKGDSVLSDISHCIKRMEKGAEVDRRLSHIKDALVKAKVEEVAAPYDDPEQIASMYFQNPNLLRSVESVVLEDQVVDYILEQAKVSERQVSFSDLMNG